MATRDGDGDIERNPSGLDGSQQTFFAFLEKQQNALDVIKAQADFLGDDALVVTLFTQILDAHQQLQCAVFAAGNVLGQAHDEGVLVVHRDDQRRNFLLAERPEGLEPAFTADQQEALAVLQTVARRDRDRLLQADALDVADDLLEHPAIAVARVEHGDLIDRDHLQVGGVVFLRHATLLKRLRSAMP